MGPCGLAAARQALRRMTRCLCARPAAAPRAGARSPRHDARGAHGTTGPSRGSRPCDCLPYWPAVKCLRGKCLRGTRLPALWTPRRLQRRSQRCRLSASRVTLRPLPTSVSYKHCELSLFLTLLKMRKLSAEWCPTLIP